jgi:hypothetical protein
MSLDRDLLAAVMAAGADVAAVERTALAARETHQAAIRRLHLAGASMREIAQALSISHQRVQQIVTVSGGSWWSRAWGTRNPKRDVVCTWCLRPPAEVAALVAGPNVYICDACVGDAERVVACGDASASLHLAGRGATARCSFCNHRRSEMHPLVVGPLAAVCGECLTICREFVDGRAV